MLYQICKDLEDTTGIFQKLTENTIILCDDIGFQNMKNIFLPFKETQDGSKDFIFDFDNEDEVVVIKEISENEIDICVGEQIIKLFWFRCFEDFRKLKTFNFDQSEDIWFSTFKSIYPLTEFKRHKSFQPFSKFMKNICRFDLPIPEDVHEFLFGKITYLDENLEVIENGN